MPQEQTIALPSLPTREERLAVEAAASWECECPRLISRLLALLSAAYAARRLCRGCRARLALRGVVETSEGLGDPSDVEAVDED
jgi:hypothetical protein